MPTEIVDKVSAHKGAERHGCGCGNGPKTDCDAAPFRGELARNDRHADRHQEPRTRPLDNAESDQGILAPGDAAEERSETEKEKRQHVGALVSEMVGHPSGSGEHHGEDQQICRQDPLHLVNTDAESRHDFRQGDVHDRGIQDSHERADHDVGENPPLIGRVLMMQRGELPHCAAAQEVADSANHGLTVP